MKKEKREEKKLKQKIKKQLTFAKSYDIIYM